MSLPCRLILIVGLFCLLIWGWICSRTVVEVNAAGSSPETKWVEQERWREMEGHGDIENRHTER